MSQVNAGDIITIEVEGHAVTIKIEDASKSEAVQAKVEASDSADHHIGQVYEFSRSLLNNIT